MGLIERNKMIIIFLVCTFFVLCYLVPVEAKSNEEIYQEKSASLKPDDIEGYYQLGLWCLKNKLIDQAKIHFNKVLELNPAYKKARQGMDNVIQLEKDAKISEIILKYGPYKNVLDKPGADKENLPWEKARERETEHFIVKTNLSVDALNDICCVMECIYFTYQDLFGCEQPKGEKLRVMIAKNKEEFQKIWHGLTGVTVSGANGRFEPALSSRNKSKQDHLLSFYDLSSGPNVLLSMLLHESVHYAIALVYRKNNLSNPSTWLIEGWATYCESGKFEGKRLVTNVINQKRLANIKDSINSRTYVTLKDLINRAQSDYDFAVCYSEGWSLIYFLLNAQDGKYKTGLRAYMEAWEKGKIVLSGVGTETGGFPQDKIANLKIFEECMGVPIEQLEKEWKEYILKLK